MSLEARLNELNIILPPSDRTGGLYTPAVVHDRVAYVSGQLPREGDQVFVVGQVGNDAPALKAKEGARLAFLKALVALKDVLGSLDRVQRVLKLTVFVQSGSGFSGQSAIADGASELIFELFGADLGGHARTAVGVAQLPRNASVEVEVIVALSA